MSENIEIIEKSDKKQGNKKTIIIAIIIVIIFFAILGAQTVFALLTLLTCVILIYKAVKKKPLKGAAIVCVVCLFLTGVCSQFSSNDYVEILSMSKEEVDRKYGEPTRHTSGVGHVYPEGFYVIYVNVENSSEAGVVSLYTSSKELLGLKLGDAPSEIEKEMKKHGYKYADSANYNGTIIYQYNKGESIAKIYVNGNIISEVEVWE